ncbi:MAG TPA: hypothetical protein VFR24_25510 [Candidatus Angelobacter sp.]|jgi:hypothetical protein|nr:hypothetical protein [Candidatus Angelobacter sp.]
MFEDEWIEEAPDDPEEMKVCEECEMYQTEIYRLNHLLRSDLSQQDCDKTRQRLGNLVQVQLEHQRKHIV